MFVKDCQQAPTLSSLLVLAQSLEIKVITSITSQDIQLYTKVIPTHSLYEWDMWHWLICFLGLLKSGTVLEIKSSSQFYILATWSFESFCKQNHSPLYTPQMALLDHSVVYKSLPRHINDLPSFVFSYF
jgi:hypothetical protein